MAEPLVAVVDPHGRVLLHEHDGRWQLPELDAALPVAPDDLTDLGRLLVVRADLGREDVEGRGAFVDRDAFGELALADSTRLVLPTLDAWIEETREPPRLAGVLLIDRQGRLLLQQRDEHPALDPLTWGLVGGHLDPGEDFESGAYRELEEETEIKLAPGSLALFREYAVHGGRMQVFLAAVDLTDDDVVCHEGLQIVFVDPDELRALDLGTAARLAVTDLLASPAYAAHTRPGAS